jgi:hypothetical protein
MVDCNTDTVRVVLILVFAHRPLADGRRRCMGYWRHLPYPPTPPITPLLAGLSTPIILSLPLLKAASYLHT